MGLGFGPTETQVEINKGMLTIKPFSTVVNNGILRFGGGTDFNAEPAMFKTNEPMQMIEKVNINDKMTERLLKYVNPIFAKQVGVSGVANFHCEKLSIPLAQGRKNDLEVIGTIGMDNMILLGVLLLDFLQITLPTSRSTLWLYR